MLGASALRRRWLQSPRAAIGRHRARIESKRAALNAATHTRAPSGQCPSSSWKMLLAASCDTAGFARARTHTPSCTSPSSTRPQDRSTCSRTSPTARVALRIDACVAAEALLVADERRRGIGETRIRRTLRCTQCTSRPHVRLVGGSSPRLLRVLRQAFSRARVQTCDIRMRSAIVGRAGSSSCSWGEVLRGFALRFRSTGEDSSRTRGVSR